MNAIVLLTVHNEGMSERIAVVEHGLIRQGSLQLFTTSSLAV
ncbi:hypothetical protein [Bradyrhizobium sp. WSM2793]|nr:hypothetical protein [Bradyrhizobium sp. WSM2793]